MFGFASSETSDYMPAAITYARMLCDKVYNYALNHNQKLGVDIKHKLQLIMVQKRILKTVTSKIHTIVVSAPSVESMPIEEVRELIQGLIDDAGLPSNMYDKKNTIIHINPTGRYKSFIFT